MKSSDKLSTKNGKRSVILLSGYLALSIPINWIYHYFYIPPRPDWLDLLFFISSYLIIALLILEEKSSLDVSHIDKCSLFIFLVFGSLLRPIDTSSLFLQWFGFIVFCGIAFMLFISLRRNKFKLSETRMIGLWIFIGIIVGGGRLIIFAILGGSYDNFPGLSAETITRIIFYFIYQLGNTTISEEFIYRGFLWGIMLRYGYENKWILLISSILFTFSHVDFFMRRKILSIIGLFVFSLLVGLSAWKSRSLVPCLIAHALTNTIANIFIIYL